MKKLLLLLLLIPFTISCSDDKDDNVIWDQDDVLNFGADIEHKRHLDIMFISDTQVRVFSYIISNNPVERADTKTFEYSKKNLPNNTVEITIYNIYDEEGYNFIGVIDNSGKTMIHIGDPSNSTYMRVNGKIFEIKDKTPFYKMKSLFRPIPTPI